MQLIARKDARQQGLKTFFTGRPCKRGHIAERRVQNSDCLLCTKEWHANDYKINIEYEKSSRRVNYLENEDRYKARAKLQRAQGYAKIWYNKNKGRWKALMDKRKQYMKERTPSWVDFEKIQEFYDNCPDGMTVDHIIPLRGKLVSGFHIHTNLQYLTRSENSEKHNKFDPMSFE